ncbi:MAG: type II toxin-antitoxin system death-on-curing family toxin [Rhodospirillales bacterium]|nr:type II toxin-antitoxin system death-on-curing family toxin [Rhodospirillales bacterium]
MPSWTRIDQHVVLAIHDEQIAEHGGHAGLTDEGLLSSALARPDNKANYQNADIAELAAAYGFGISSNHPFLDGNKRTAFVVVELFLNLNGYQLNADDIACVQTFLSLAAGNLSEKDLATWLRAHISPVPD